MRKKVNFILPHFARVPGGGAKVIYEYANIFAEHGHDVSVYHNLQTPHYPYSSYKPFILRKLKSMILEGNKAQPRWIEMHPEVKMLFLDKLESSRIRDADATVSTWWSLAKPLAELPFTKGLKLNLIQDYEVWLGHDALVHESYSYPEITQVAISPAVLAKVREYNPDVHYVPNAINTQVFKQTTDILLRKSRSFLMMYSPEPRKGSQVGLLAFGKLKEIFPDVRLKCFGVGPRPDLPEWIEYVQNPENLPDFYNGSAFFVTNSIAEGWGLPLHEAMACGCVSVCTDIPGHYQFTSGNGGILTYPPGDSEKLLDVLSFCCNLEEDRLREKSLMNKNQVKDFSWQISYEKMLKIILDQG